MIIDEHSDAEDAVTADATAGAGTAYIEGMTSVDGFTRGPTGKIKFNKDTKKRRREEAAQDVEMAEAGAELPTASKPKKPKRKDEPKFGHEFKAKVSILFWGGWVADRRCRKRAAMSKRAGLIPTPTCPCHRRRRAPRRARAVSRGNDECRPRGGLCSVLLDSFLSLSKMHVHVIQMQLSSRFIPVQRTSSVV